MEDQKTREQNALKILALAADKYLAGQDELGKSFIGPQIQAAVEIIGKSLAAQWEPASVIEEEAVETKEKATSSKK